RLADARRAIDRDARVVRGAGDRDRRIERRHRDREDFLYGQARPVLDLVAGSVGQGDSVSEIRRELQLGETAREIHLGDIRRRSRSILGQQLDRLIGRGTYAVERTQLALYRAVIELGLSLVGFVVLDERGARCPFVDEKSAE